MENNYAYVQETAEKNGSIVGGIVGALIGAAIGAVLWAVVGMLGYIASIIGFVIAFLASKGYDLCKGRQGKGKVVILIFAVLFGVLLGTVLPDIAYLVQGIAAGEFVITYGEIPSLILGLVLFDSEYQAAILHNGGMGLLFAALGAFALLRKTGKEVQDPKLTYLD